MSSLVEHNLVGRSTIERLMIQELVVMKNFYVRYYIIVLISEAEISERLQSNALGQAILIF